MHPRKLRKTEEWSKYVWCTKNCYKAPWFSYSIHGIRIFTLFKNQVLWLSLLTITIIAKGTWIGHPYHHTDGAHLCLLRHLHCISHCCIDSVSLPWIVHGFRTFNHSHQHDDCSSDGDDTVPPGCRIRARCGKTEKKHSSAWFDLIWFDLSWFIRKHSIAARGRICEIFNNMKNTVPV